MKKGMEILENETPVQSIVRFLNEGRTESEVYEFICDKCALQLKSKADRIGVAAHIAEVAKINVFAEEGEQA
tara:strand:+ start:415 stop:630 length:216 start_codon:yes stop_codon:yes gene_type:complete